MPAACAKTAARERRYGRFRRTINLPPGVERDQLRATLEFGLLEIVVEGVASPAQDERIEIEAADRDEVSIDVGGNTSVRPPE